MNHVEISIIIPHKDSLDCLPRLLNSIPKSDKIEVVIVDNSIIPIQKDDIKSDRLFKLLYSNPSRYAGGARNVGLKEAVGKWIIFADADDFFTSNAFDAFATYVNSNYDLIYFKSDSVYDDTLLPSDRNIPFNNVIDEFMLGHICEIEARISFSVPWAKMVRKTLIDQNNIKFDEVIAANDVMFSTLSGFHSCSFAVVTDKVYVVTTRKGSLANRQDLAVILSRYEVSLRRNSFLKKHRLGKYQSSVMIYIYMVSKYGIAPFFYVLKKALRYHQNIFIGFSHWIQSYRADKYSNKKNAYYISK